MSVMCFRESFSEKKSEHDIIDENKKKDYLSVVFRAIKISHFKVIQKCNEMLEVSSFEFYMSNITKCNIFHLLFC